MIRHLHLIISSTQFLLPKTDFIIYGPDSGKHLRAWTTWVRASMNHSFYMGWEEDSYSWPFLKYAPSPFLAICSWAEPSRYPDYRLKLAQSTNRNHRTHQKWHRTNLIRSSKHWTVMLSNSTSLQIPRDLLPGLSKMVAVSPFHSQDALEHLSNFFGRRKDKQILLTRTGRDSWQHFSSVSISLHISAFSLLGTASQFDKTSCLPWI